MRDLPDQFDAATSQRPERPTRRQDGRKGADPGAQSPSGPSTYTLRTLLGEAMPRLRPAERSVATLLLNRADEFGDMSLDQLAAAAGVSQTTVVRMCKELGFGGFRAFRLRWVQEAATRAARRDVARDEGPARVRSPFHDVYAALKESEPLLAPTLHEAAERIARADRLFAFASGNSSYVAALAAEAFSVLGRLAVAYRADQLPTAPLAHVGPTSAVLVISYRGENPKLEDGLKMCRDQGATGIVLTSGAGSSLARLADVLLLTGAPIGQDSRQLELVPARALQVAAVYALVQEVKSRIAAPAVPGARSIPT